MTRSRENWVDLAKGLACVLVVVGHLMQSMVKSDLMDAGALYGWFQATVYTFHVPVFFICSGYLYQRYSKVDSPGAWWLNARRKLLVLGVPYAAFTAATLAMKALAGDAVNDAGGGLLQTLFLSPTAPYWYLYTLFFIFLITPTARDGRSCAVILAVSAGGRLFMLLGGSSLGLPYCMSQTLVYWVWFACGMALVALGWRRLLTPRAVAVGALFLPLSVLGYALGFFTVPAFGLLVGAMACACVLSLALAAPEGGLAGRIGGGSSRWTLPVYLMHTIFAAGTRVVLLKLGVASLPLHLAAGLIASFAGPVVAMLAMERLRPLDFLVYPGRYVELSKEES